MPSPPSSHSLVALRLMTTGISSVVTDSESPNSDELKESSLLGIMADPRRVANIEDVDVGLSSTRAFALRTLIGIGRGRPPGVIVPGDSGRHWHKLFKTSI